jgi:hypothetical protein
MVVAGVKIYLNRFTTINYRARKKYGAFIRNSVINYANGWDLFERFSESSSSTGLTLGDSQA